MNHTANPSFRFILMIVLRVMLPMNALKMFSRPGRLLRCFKNSAFGTKPCNKYCVQIAELQVHVCCHYSLVLSTCFNNRLGILVREQAFDHFCNMHDQTLLVVLCPNFKLFISGRAEVWSLYWEPMTLVCNACTRYHWENDAYYYSTMALRLCARNLK